MNTSQFMDKQIMDLSNSHSSINNPTTNDSDFLDLINPRTPDHRLPIGGGEGDSDKKEEIRPSYDFQPIRPVVVSSSPPSSKLDSSCIGASPRAWNSADISNSIRNHIYFEPQESSRFNLEKDHIGVDPILVSEIDRTMKKYADNLMHGLDNVSARLSQLESRTRHIENSLDELKVSVGTNYESSDGRLRQLENILGEVQDGVKTIKDKQEIMDARLTLAKLQVKVEQPADIQSTEQVESSLAGLTLGQQSQQQLPPVPLTHPPSVPPPNAPPPPASQQNMPPHVPLPSHFPPNQVPTGPQRESYFASPPPPPPPGQTPENLSQQYQMSPGQQLQASSQPQPPPQPQHQYQSLPQLPYSQPPAPSQPHASLPTVNPSQHHLPLTHHHPEESPYPQSQNYPPNVRQNPPPPPPNAAPPHGQFYGGPSNMYEPPANRPGPGFPGTFGPSASSTEQYPYGGSSSQYGGGSPVKPQQMSSAMGHGSGGNAYPHLPTARILPQAIPTASGVGGGPGSPGSGNRVPIDDVVDKVTNMGFSRDQVRATVRKLTENGQAVDLNVVLDKLMNDGDVQPPRGWFGR